MKLLPTNSGDLPGQISHVGSDVLNEVRLGNRDAFFFLYEEYHGRLYGYILTFVKIPAFAEDLLQEVFLKIWERRDKINPSLSFKAYLYKICRNAIFDFIKEMAADKEMRMSLKAFIPQEINAVDIRLLSKEYEAVLELAVSNLPPQRRNIFTLCRHEGKKYDEVAAMLHISRNTVKEHMVLAVKSIREYVAKNTDIPISFLLLLAMLSIG